ncbi:MAG: SAF domain-containing protein, partial [Aggregatilineales bacterium]
VPEGRNSILIPFDTMLSVSYGVQQGDHVALEVVQDGSTVETFEDAIILGVLSDPDRLVVAVLPTDATTYFDLIDSGADFQISINQISIRSGMQSVSIPIDQIGSASLWIVEGDVVVIISDDGLTTVSPSATVLRKTQEYLYVEVTPLEATRLTRIIEAGSPLTFALLSEDLAEIVTQIVVATQIIGRGEVITEEDVALRGWSSNAVPENAITSIEDVVGMRARTDIFTQQPILTSMVIEDFTPSMSDLDIPAGKRAVAMPFNTDSMSYSVQEGDYVSIGIVPNDSTDVVVENALILAVNEDIVYVAVSPTEAVVLASLVTSGTDLYLYLIPITESSGETRQIVVSVQNIQRGEIIQEEDVALRNWQPNAIPENAITSTESVIGMRARTDVFVEQPILTSMVLPTTPVASANGTCCANIPLDQISDASMWIMENDVITIRIGADVLTTSATVVLVTQDFISVDVTTSIYTLIERRVEEGSVFTAFLTNTEDETNTETRQIVVALRDIERGARIVRADLEMADVPIDLIPEGAYTDFESVIGHRARVDFDAGAPISEALLVPTLNEDFEYEFEFADNAEIIEIPMRQVYMPGTGEFRNVIIESELPNGTIITVSHHAYVGYGATEVEPEEVYGIIVPTEDADLLQGFVNSGFPIRMYGFSVESDDTEIAGIIPTGLRAIAIPMPAVLMDDPLQVVGSRVDVLAAMYFVDVDGEFQSIVPGQENVVQGGLNAAWNLGQQATLENGETPELVIQRTILNALVVQYQAVEITGEDGWVEPNENAQTPIVTLAVSPQDAVILNYLIDANIPLAFIRSGG